MLFEAANFINAARLEAASINNIHCQTLGWALSGPETFPLSEDALTN